MTKWSADRLLDQTLLALADPTRREILRRLTRGDARVTALAEPFPLSLNSISKHIKILERAGLVTRRRVGREHILRFQLEPLYKVQEWIARQEAFWRVALAELDRLLSQETENKENR